MRDAVIVRDCNAERVEVAEGMAVFVIVGDLVAVQEARAVVLGATPARARRRGGSTSQRPGENPITCNIKRSRSLICF